MSAISVGGGLSIPYRTGEEDVDTAHYFQIWDAARRQIETYLAIPYKWKSNQDDFFGCTVGSISGLN